MMGAENNIGLGRRIVNVILHPLDVILDRIDKATDPGLGPREGKFREPPINDRSAPQQKASPTEASTPRA